MSRNSYMHRRSTAGIIRWLAHLPGWLLIVCCAGTAAQGSSASFDEANKLYEQGNFSEAAAAYQQLLQAGKSAPSVYFNLGNAWFKAGRIGRGIAAYLRAEELTPRDPDIRANLQFARNQVSGPSLRRSGWEQWRNRLTVNEWAVFTSVVFWVLLLGLAALQWKPSLKQSARGAVLSVSVVAVFLLFCLVSSIRAERAKNVAVVIVPEAEVRHGPLEESQAAFTVHDGAELQVLDRKGEWLQVTAEARRSGWLRTGEVLLVE